MKGLLLKDLYMARKYMKSYFFMIVAFLAASLFNSENLFFVFYPCLMCGMIPMGLLGYDERSRWDAFSCTLPCTRAQMVSAKYLLGFGAQCIVILATLLLQGLRMHLTGGIAWKELLGLLEILVILPCLSTGVTMPFMFKLGVEKGRLAYYVMVGMVCGGGVLASGLFAETGAVLTFTPGLGLLCFLSLAVYGVSWYLSILFYQKREF